MMHGQKNIKLSKSSVTAARFLPGRAKDLSAPLYKARTHNKQKTPCN